MKTVDNSELRQQTIRYWATFVNARSDADVARVHAFQALLRNYANDISNVTDNEVTVAYGGRGWAPTPVCWECGCHKDSNIIFGLATTGGEKFALCGACIDSAKTLFVGNIQAPAPVPVLVPQKRSFFSRLKGA